MTNKATSGKISRKIKKIYGLYISKLKKFIFYDSLSYKNVLGHGMYLNKNCWVSENLAKYGVWEKIETDYILKEIQEGDVVLDIGANIGYYTLILAKLVGNSGKVFAFEPEPNNFNLLKKNVKKNRYQNVILENMALSNSNGKIKLYLAKQNRGEHRIYRSKAVSNDFVEVNMMTLDEYFKNVPLIEKIAFIKMDVEGSEWGVLQGMRSLLEKKSKLKILLEFDPDQIMDFGTNPKDIINFLHDECFKFSYVDEKEKQIKNIDFNFLLQKCDNGLKPINLICIKE